MVKKGGVIRKSFTLIELIVVIAIIAVLAAVVAPNAFKAIEKSKVAEGQGDFKAFKASIYSLYGDTGQWFAQRGNRISAGSNELWLRLDNYTELSINPLTYLGGERDDPAAVLTGIAMPGWDGPYVEKLKGKTPWSGTYYVQASNCVGAGSRGISREIWLEFENECFSSNRRDCGLAPKTAERFDSLIDDGNVKTGDFRSYTGDGRGGDWCYWSAGDTLWVFVSDT